MTPQLLVVDRDLARVGIVDEIIELDAQPRWRDVGGWRLTAQGDVVDALKEPGSGIVIRVGKTVIFSGPATKPGWGPPGTVTVAGVDDLVWLRRRLALPGATSPMPLTDTYSGPAETAIHDIVDENLGPSAAVARRKVTVAADQARGTSGDWNATGQPVLDLVAKIAGSQGWGLQVRRQPDGTLHFEVLVPRDRTARVRLSDVNETIGDWWREREAPSTTHTYVGGEVDRDLDQRVVVDGGVASEWGRIETWEDARTSSDTGELEQVRDDALEDGAAIDAVTAEIQPAADFSFPADYRVGDLVAVTVDGDRFVANVVGLNITETDVRPVLSQGLAVPSRPSIRAIRDLQRRVARQETL